MRTVYITSGDVVATVGSDKADAGVGSGLMVNAEGKTVGFDLFCEAQPGVWVHADQVPSGVLAEERRRGQLSHGIYYNGRLHDKLNVYNIHDRLIAAKVGLEVKDEDYKGGSTAFKAQIGEPLDVLVKSIEGLKQQIQELRVLDSEARRAEVEALKARTKKMKRDIGKLREEESNEQVRPEQVEPHPLDFLTDITRAYSGKTLSTASLEMLAKAQQITDYVDENNDLMLNPEKMRALRALLFS